MTVGLRRHQQKKRRKEIIEIHFGIPSKAFSAKTSDMMNESKSISRMSIIPRMKINWASFFSSTEMILSDFRRQMSMSRRQNAFVFFFLLQSIHERKKRRRSRGLSEASSYLLLFPPKNVVTGRRKSSCWHYKLFTINHKKNFVVRRCEAKKKFFLSLLIQW